MSVGKARAARIASAESREGYEVGIMRGDITANPYAPFSKAYRDYVAGYRKGQLIREILDERGLKRIERHIEQADDGTWNWWIRIETVLMGEGNARTQCEASQCIEDIGVEHVKVKTND